MTISDDDRMFRDKQGYGVLAGEALSELDGVETQMLDGGMAFILQCQDFGHKNAIQIDWPTLILLSNRVVPPGWTRTNSGRAYPNTACKKCGVLTSVYLTPDEATRYVRQGVAANKVSQQQIQQVMARVQR